MRTIQYRSSCILLAFTYFLYVLNGYLPPWDCGFTAGQVLLRFLLSATEAPRRLAILQARDSNCIYYLDLHGDPCYTLIPRTDSQPVELVHLKSSWRAAYAKPCIPRHSTLRHGSCFPFLFAETLQINYCKARSREIPTKRPSWLPDPFQVSCLLHSVFYVKMSLACLKSHRRISVTSTCANDPSRGSSSASQPPTSLPPAYPLTPISPRVSTTVSSASNFHLATAQPPLQRRRRRRPLLPPATSTKPSSLSASIPSTKIPCAALRSTSCTPSPPTSTACRSTC